MDADVVAADIRLLPQRIAQWSDEIVSAAQEHGVDPILVAAILERESRGGDALCPKGACGTGDFSRKCSCGCRVFASYPAVVRHCQNCGVPVQIPEIGWGRGLMQIDARSHQSWLLVNDWTNPGKNIGYGAHVLATAIKEVGGNVLAGIAGYNAGAGRVKRDVLARGPYPDDQSLVNELDRVTTNKYVSGVLRIADSFRATIDTHKAAVAAEGNNNA